MKLGKVTVTILILMPVCSTNGNAGVIANPSFEDDAPGYWVVPTGWSINDSDRFGEGVATYFATHGSNNYYLWSWKNSACTAGSYESIYQSVDLTGITQILFDARLAAWSNTLPQPFDHYEGVFLVDGTPYWTRTSEGTYLDQSIDVSSLSGFHVIELRNECVETGLYQPSYWTEWDNLRAIPEPAMLSLLMLGGLAVMRRKR